MISFLTATYWIVGWLRSSSQLLIAWARWANRPLLPVDVVVSSIFSFKATAASLRIVVTFGMAGSLDISTISESFSEIWWQNCFLRDLEINIISNYHKFHVYLNVYIYTWYYGIFKYLSIYISLLKLWFYEVYNCYLFSLKTLVLIFSSWQMIF